MKSASISLAFMPFRVLATCLLLAAAVACRGGGLFTQYEYEEETYLSLDGRATLYVNSSLDALNALRGSTFDPAPAAAPDKAAIAAFFTGAGVAVTRVTFSSRNGRTYAHIRMDVDDVRRLAGNRPFAWSSYAFSRDGNLYVYRQRVGPSAGGRAAAWRGDEIVAFRLHIPSKVPYHNAGADNLRRGNILVWEQPLADRLAGRPLEIEARMEAQSILYTTLALFGATIVVVAAGFAIVIWWIVRRARRQGGTGRPDAARRAS